MYSKSFVGLPKKGVPSAFGTCGESRMSEAASVRGVSAWGRIPASVTNGRPRSFPEERAHPGAERSVAHVQEVDPMALEPRPVLVDQPPDRGREHVGAVPGAEGPHEGEQVCVRRDAELLAGPPPLLGREAERGRRSSGSIPFG